MSITNHFIDGLPVRVLDHVGVRQTPRLVVIHYSVTNTVAQAVAALNASNLGYHILIEKNGQAFQTRGFDRHAAHPGLSNWKAESGVTLGSSLGRNSIGICLMNMGFAFDTGSPSAPGRLSYNADDPTMQRWEVYPDAQVETARRIVRDVIANYPITEIVGHHDVAILGKFDPGPLFDLQALNAMLPSPPPLGLRTKVRSSDGTLNVRRLPNTSAPPVERLNNGDVVHIRSVAYGRRPDCVHPSPGQRARYLTKWASVDIDGSNRHAGFVHMGGLEATPLDAGLAAFL